jgi:hypothetical protein
MSFSALEGRYNDTVYIDLIEALDPDDNPWTVAIVDLMRVGEVADGLYMAAVFSPGRLIHRAAPVWSLEEARTLADQFFAEIIAGTFVPIPYAIKPLEPIIKPEDEE